MSAGSVRECLESLNEKCEAFCIDESNWTEEWRGADSHGNPNFLLAYSHVDTFKSPGGVMILGTNPAGDHNQAHMYPISDPFECSGWSSYLDDDWDEGYEPGQSPVQLAVQSVAEIVSGRSDRVNALLRRSPTGNLIPFRSDGLSDLPPDAKKLGRAIGLQLIELAQPRVLILIASRQDDWRRLMRRFGNLPYCQWDLDEGKEKSANFFFREARRGGGWPRYVFALPAVNASNQARAPESLALLRKRVEKHGRTRLLGHAGRRQWR